jgi:tetratricopeptide (TPR) repeat protein
MLPSNWTTTSLAFISIAMLCWQGFVLIGRRCGFKRFGLFTLLLGVICMLLESCLLSGSLLFSPELRVFLAEGSFPRMVLGIFLFGVAVLAGLGWLMAEVRSRARLVYGVAILCAGLVAGTASLLHIRTLNPQTIKPLQVASYELLWPWPVLWVLLCLTQATGASFGSKRYAERLFCTTLSFLLISQYALRPPLPADPALSRAWLLVSTLSLFASLALFAWKAALLVGIRDKVMRLSVSIVPLLLASGWVEHANGEPRGGPWYLLLGASAIAVCCSLGFYAVRLFRKDSEHGVEHGVENGVADDPDAGVEIRTDNPLGSRHGARRTVERSAGLIVRAVRTRWVPLVARVEDLARTRARRSRGNWMPTLVLTLVFAGLLLASYLATTDPRFRLTGLAMGPRLDSSAALSGAIFLWVLAVEVLGPGPLTERRAIQTGNQELEAAISPLQRSWFALRGSLIRGSRVLHTRVRALFAKAPKVPGDKAPAPPAAAAADGQAAAAGREAESLPEVLDAKASGWLGSLAKVLAGLLILIALREIPNAHKTIIQPFQASKEEAGLSKDAGQEASDEVIASLGQMSTYLKSVLISLRPGASRGSPVFRSSANLGNDAGKDAVGDANSLSLPGGFKVPADMLLLPIQGPMRWLLGVRIINGSVHRTSEGHMLLATSSGGETWSETSPDTSDAAIAQLAKKIAFRIAARDPAFEGAGLGHVWDAYDSFTKGVDASEHFQAEHKSEDLTRSIQCYREAVRKDPDFALAYYRLGLALRDDGDPGGAVASLRKSINADPSFIPGYVALASTLQDFDSYKPGSAAILPKDQPSSGELKEEAETIWEQVATFPLNRTSLSDRAAAYFGICTTLDPGAPEHLQLAYLYCRRAEQFFARLPSELREEPLIRQSEASTINEIGILFYRERNARTPVDSWMCSEDSTPLPPADLDALRSTGKARSYIWVMPYHEAAKEYFALAHLLLPADGIVACNAALADYSAGDPGPMNTLEGRASVRNGIGQAFERMAKASHIPEYYFLAMREFQWAWRLDMNDVWALNNFAYAFWEYRLARPATQLPPWLRSDEWLGPDIGYQAEWAARRAHALAETLDSLDDRITIQSTLGEVLLAKSRPEEAVEVLSKVLEVASTHSTYDEIRWDLSQALICDSVSKAGPASDMERAHAAETLGVISGNAVANNQQMWLHHADLLDPQQAPQAACSNYTEEVDRDPSHAFLLQSGFPQYSRHDSTGTDSHASFCGSTSVIVQVPDRGSAGPRDAFLLHVWGGPNDSYINAYAVPMDRVPLILEAQKETGTNHYYFAQLWMRGAKEPPSGLGRPVSARYSIPTDKREAGSCMTTAILLSFTPVPSSPRQEGTAPPPLMKIQGAPQ